MLSNFTKYPIVTVDGPFESVEGYWHWLGIEDNCPEKENLRSLYGYQAKKYGTELKRYTQFRADPDFETKILKAIWYKLKGNTQYFLPQYNELPFEHYYVFGPVTRSAKEKYIWMIDGIDKMRNHIIENQDNPKF